MRTKIYNKIITLIVLISVIFSMIGIGIKETYALETGLDSKEYTKTHMKVHVQIIPLCFKNWSIIALQCYVSFCCTMK